MTSPFQKFFRDLTQHGLEYFGLFYGSYRGVVIDNRDPEMLGRLKISCAAIYGDEVPDYWAWPKVPYAGNQAGFFAIPEIGDGIYIECEGGNPKYPIWSGGWWAKPDSASEVPETARLSPPSNRIWQSASGHRIELDDSEGAEKIKITEKSGNYILLESASGKEEHQVSGDKQENIGGNWNITVVGKATIKANVIELDGGTGSVMGVITGASVCHFSGVPHGDKSNTVKASK